MLVELSFVAFENALHFTSSPQGAQLTSSGFTEISQVTLRAAFVLACCVTPVAFVHGQGSTPGATGTIIGFAVDSVRGGYLREAIVTLSNTNRSQVTDSIGRFRFDGVNVGSYSLRLSHPVLDTLGLTVASPSFDLIPSGVTVMLAVPSPQRIVARKCSVDARRAGEAALVGVVFDADTEMPSTGAEVVVAWTDYTVGTKSVASVPQRRVGAVRSDGSFVVCGIPPDLATGVYARRGADSTAAIPTGFSTGIALQGFHLPGPHLASDDSPAGTSGRTAGSAVLHGIVTDASGRPVDGARVAMENDTAVAVTGHDGRFTMRGLRAGTGRVDVRRLGFEPVEQAVDLRSSTPTEIAFRLTKFVPVLEAVRVSALRELGLERVGFAARKRMGMGRYLAPEDLERRNSPRLNDALRMVPSLRAGRTNTGETYITGRFGDCLRYFVDGKLWADRGQAPDTFLGGLEIGAIEVYTPLSAPAEFMAISRTGATCTTVVVWTRWKLRIK